MFCGCLHFQERVQSHGFLYRRFPSFSNFCIGTLHNLLVLPLRCALQMPTRHFQATRGSHCYKEFKFHNASLFHHWATALVCVIHKGEKGLNTTQEGGGWLYILSHGVTWILYHVFCWSCGKIINFSPVSPERNWILVLWSCYFREIVSATAKRFSQLLRSRCLHYSKLASSSMGWKHA